MLDLILLDLELRFADYWLPGIALLLLLGCGLLFLGFFGLRLWFRLRVADLLLQGVGGFPLLLLLSLLRWSNGKRQSEFWGKE
jgi:hypothetical protein